MADPLNEVIRDEQVRHAVYLARHGNYVSRQVLTLLNKLDKRLLKQLRAIDPDSKKADRLREALLIVNNLMDLQREALGPRFDKAIAALAKYEVDFQNAMLQRNIPIAVAVSVPSSHQILAAATSRPFQGRNIRQWVSEWDRAKRSKIQQIIKQGFVEGATIDEIVRQLRGTKALNYRDGQLEASRRYTEMLVRTSLNHVANAARERLYRSNDDLIKGVQWVSTLDSRTTILCGSLDGELYDIGKGPRPPAHPNCRSVTTPIVKSWEELGANLREVKPGTRASMDGSVPRGTTFERWLHGQPAAVQAEVLGDTRRKLWKQGKLTLDRFVDDSGQLYSLDELRELEGGAFSRADL